MNQYQYPRFCARCSEPFVFGDLTVVLPDGTRRHYVFCPFEQKANREWWAEARKMFPVG